MDNVTKKILYISKAAYSKILQDANEYHGMTDLCTQFIAAVGCGIDRTGTFEDQIKHKLLFEIPDTAGFSKSYDEICLNRAEELVNKNKMIHLYWSGGIDSTCALVSILQVLKDYDQLIITMEPRSIDEYSWFYETYIKNKKHIMSNRFAFRILPPPDDKILITGGHGDQIFGNYLAFKHMDKLYRPWKELFDYEEYFEFKSSTGRKTLGRHKQARVFLQDHIDNFLAKSPFDIKTIFDFYWWLSFVIEWQTTDFASFCYTENYMPKHVDNTYSFFNTDDFQRWSMVNHDLKIKNTEESYKFTTKEFIYKFTGDADYRDHKKKESSGNPFSSNDKSINTVEIITKRNREKDVPLIIDENHNGYSFKTIENNMKQFEHLRNNVDYTDKDKWIHLKNEY